MILREINFGESRSSKTALLAILGALKMINLGKSAFINSQKNHNTERLNVLKRQIVHF